MKLKILKDKLKEGLSIVERIVAKSLTLPILNNILLKAEKNFLNLSSTDLEIGIKWWSLAKIEKEGEIVIPARVLSNFVGLLEEKPVTLDTDGQSLIIKAEKYHTKIKGFSSEEFPIIPQLTENESVLLDNASFCQGLNQVVQIPILSSARPEISGVYLLFQKEELRIVATDSFRLGEKKIFFKKPLSLNQDYSMILPQKAAKEIVNIFGERKGELKIYFSPNQVLFESLMEETDHPEIQIVSKLIEGEYPNYQAIFPRQAETEVTLKRPEFLNQLRAASLFASKMNEVRIKTNNRKSEIDISSQNPELGEYQSSLPGKIKGKSSSVSFNYRFLIDGLMNIKSSEILLELNGEDGPAVLKPVGDQSYVYLVMPVKAS
jgi:DNA polymerase-3 subunit beta